MVTFTCPSCHKTLRAGEEKAGQIAQCPNCKKRVEVPSLSVSGPIVSPLDSVPPQTRRETNGIAGFVQRYKRTVFISAAIAVPVISLVFAFVGYVAWSYLRIPSSGDAEKWSMADLLKHLKNENLVFCGAERFDAVDLYFGSETEVAKWTDLKKTSNPWEFGVLTTPEERSKRKAVQEERKRLQAEMERNRVHVSRFQSPKEATTRFKELKDKLALKKELGDSEFRNASPELRDPDGSVFAWGPFVFFGNKNHIARIKKLVR
jgi:hypothetical protein